MIDSPSSGERNGKSLNRLRYGAAGVVGPRAGCSRANRNGLERPAAGGDSPVRASPAARLRYLSRAGHVQSCPNPRGPSRKAKYVGRPTVNQYREGKVRSTHGMGVKKTLKPFVYKRSEQRCDGVPFA